MPNRFLNNITINDEYTLPSSDGSANQVIATDGSGNLSFVDQSGGTSLSGGTNNYVPIWTSSSTLSSSALYISGTSPLTYSFGSDSVYAGLKVNGSTTGGDIATFRSTTSNSGTSSGIVIENQGSGSYGYHTHIKMKSKTYGSCKIEMGNQGSGYEVSANDGSMYLNLQSEGSVYIRTSGTSQLFTFYTNGGLGLPGGGILDGGTRRYSWTPVSNSTTNSGYYRLVDINGLGQSDRFIIQLVGRSTSYSDGTLGAMGYIVGQANNDNNVDLVFYNHSGEDEVVDEVGLVDDGTTGCAIWVKVGQYAEVGAFGYVTNQNTTFTTTSSYSSSQPTGYSAVTEEYIVWNSKNDGANSGLNADLLDGEHGSYYLNYNNFTNTPTILTGNGTSGRVPIYNGTTSFTTDSGFTYSSNKLGIDHTITSNGFDVLSNTTSRTLELGDVSGNDDIHEVNIKVYGDNKIAVTDDNVTVKKPKFTSLSAQNSEATALMINGSNVVGTRELGSNAFNSTSFLTSESDTLATVTGRGASTSTRSTFSAGINTNTTSTRDKISVYTGAPYVIGMQSGITYGHLNDWGMTFQFNDDNDRGFWWGDSGHSTAQGAMSLTTNGRLTVAESISVGQGASVTSPSTVPLYVDGFAVFDTTSGTEPVCITRSGSTSSQALKIGVTDTVAQFNYVEDTSSEGTGNFGRYDFILGGNSSETSVTALKLEKTKTTSNAGAFTFGTPGNGSNTLGRWLSFEGNADSGGEGSGRLFFSEHNSTTSAMDNYGMSIGYRGGSTSVTTAGGNSWTGLSQIGNGQWGMWGHDNSLAGALIMYGDRQATFVNFAGNNITGVNRITTTEHVISGNNVYAGGTQGFVFGSSTSEGEYIQRNGNNIEFVAGGAIKFDVHATNGVHVRNGSTYYAQISNTGIGRFANDVIAYYNFSDKRLKTNIKSTKNNLDKVLKLNPVEYNWKEGYRKNKKEIGLIAQEVEKIIPEVVRENERLNDDTLYKQVDYEHLVSTLIGAVQEQQKQIDELKSIINGSS